MYYLDINLMNWNKENVFKFLSPTTPNICKVELNKIEYIQRENEDTGIWEDISETNAVYIHEGYELPEEE